MDKNSILKRLSKAVIDGDEESAEKAANDAIKTGIDPLLAIDEGLSKGMKIVGEKFSTLEIYLPDVMLAADAIKAGIKVLKPHISAASIEKSKRGKIVIGTVQGDIHDIGKNLVVAMLEIDGFEVYDVGRDAHIRKFLDKAKEVNADIIALSALMTTSMFFQKDLIDYLEDAGLRDKYCIMVGGAPIEISWVKKIKADGYGANAKTAVEVAKALMKGNSLPVIIGR